MPAPVLMAAPEPEPPSERPEAPTKRAIKSSARNGNGNGNGHANGNAHANAKEAPTRPRRSATAPRAQSQSTDGSEGAYGDEEFRAYAMRIGHDRAQALLAQLFDPFLADVPEDSLL